MFLLPNLWMVTNLVRLLGVAVVFGTSAVTADTALAPDQHRWEDIRDHRGNDARVLQRDSHDGRGEEGIEVIEGIVFQKSGCPQVISETQAMENYKDASLPGNVIHLVSAGGGRTGNHFLVVSEFFAMAYCCKSKVLRLPLFDDRFPSVSEDGKFESDKHYFDFSGVDRLPLEEYEGMSEDPDVCPPSMEIGGMPAFWLTGIHPYLLECTNRVYLRGCEANYLEPLLGTSDFCEKPPASNRRRLDQDGDDTERHEDQSPPGASKTPLAETSPRMPSSNATAAALAHSRTSLRQGTSVIQQPRLGVANTRPSGHEDGFIGTSFGRGGDGSAGSLVMHMRSGDIFMAKNVERMKNSFPGYGQFYLRAIASQPWSDVTIITFSLNPKDLNPTYAALEMMQRSGALGPNVVMHKNRDLLDDIQAMLCADGLAISRSTLHFLTFAHTRAKHHFVPSECGPGTYTRKSRKKLDGTKKPNPNNTTLLCIEKPDAEVYGVEWEVNEDAYGIYNSWQASEEQYLDMVLFDGIKGLEHCCDR